MVASKTKGIVLNQFKYSETSIIVNVLTEEHGKMSFVVNGVRKKKSKIPASYFQAFSLLQITYISSNKSDLHKITEVTSDTLLQNIIFDIQKSSICLFLAEFVNISLQALEKESNYFNFLQNLIQYIDQAESRSINNIHIWTIIRILQFNGIAPDRNYNDINCYFDPVSAQFTSINKRNAYVWDVSLSFALNALLQAKIDESYAVNISRKERNLIIEKMVEYFKIHIDGFKTSKSLQILTEIFD